MKDIQGRSFWGGHPNILRKFVILSINPEKFDHLGCPATPKFWSSGFGHPKYFALATPLKGKCHQKHKIAIIGLLLGFYYKQPAYNCFSPSFLRSQGTYNRSILKK